MSTSLASWSRPADRSIALVAGLLAAAAFLASWAVLHVGFYDRSQLVDTPVYERYGDAVESGEVPYRDFGLEYPPGALPVFVIPSLAAAEGDEDGYREAFELLMACCGVAALGAMAVALAGLGASPTRLALALGVTALAPLALGSVMLTRYDLWPAALTVAALAALLGGRDGVAAGLLALGVAAKLYPAALLPLAAVWIWRRAGRRAFVRAAAVFGGVLAATVLPFVLAAPGGFWDVVSRQLSRPLQIESLGSAVAILVHHLGGLDLEVITSHGSQNIGGSVGEAVGTVASLLQVGVVAGLWVAFARGAMQPERLVRYSAAAVVALVVLGKVLSPQFLIWLLPLVPLVRGRRGVTASAVLAAALVVTQIWFPYRYWELPNELDPTVASLVLLRDVLLLGVLFVLVRPERGEVTRWAEEVGETWDGQPISREKPHGVAVLVWRSGPAGREWLVLHRAHEGPEYAGDWAWGPPAGARHPGEPIDECARRELQEEAGLLAVPERTGSGTDEWAVYVAEAPADAAVSLSDEHDRFEWLGLDAAVGLCLPPRVGRDFRAVSAFLDRR